MARAAWAVAAAVIRRAGPSTPVVLLVGPGNNGADALYAGALLRRRGYPVAAVLADTHRVHPQGLLALGRNGGRVQGAPRVQFDGAVVIDGLLGIGARPDVSAFRPLLQLLRNARPAAVIAVDLPTGVHPDTGVTDADAVRADLTVTFGAPSTGLLVSSATGELEVAELGLAPSGAPDAVAVQDDDVPDLTPGSTADKFSSGVLGIHAGSADYPGAAVLCTGAAVRLRPGLVRYAGECGPAVLARWPEVVASTTIGTAGRVQAWVIGPGTGTGGATVRALAEILEQDVPVVVDADGLTVLAGHPELLAHRMRRDAPPVVLTPHAGEFARLFPDIDTADRVGATRRAAARCGALVLLKGHRTVVAAPDGDTAVNLSGTGWLATAGSGDVLSGIIGSLLATGMTAFLAAASGAYLHGRAGERAQRVGAAGAQALWDHLR